MLNAVPDCLAGLAVAHGGEGWLGIGRITQLAAQAATGNLGHLDLPKEP
jgi:hypothetical protein